MVRDSVEIKNIWSDSSFPHLVWCETRCPIISGTICQVDYSSPDFKISQPRSFDRNESAICRASGKSFRKLANSFQIFQVCLHVWKFRKSFRSILGDLGGGLTGCRMSTRHFGRRRRRSDRRHWVSKGSGRMMSGNQERQSEEDWSRPHGADSLNDFLRQWRKLKVWFYEDIMAKKRFFRYRCSCSIRWFASFAWHDPRLLTVVVISAHWRRLAQFYILCRFASPDNIREPCLKWGCSARVSLLFLALIDLSSKLQLAEVVSPLSARRWRLREICLTPLPFASCCRCCRNPRDLPLSI